MTKAINLLADELVSHLPISSFFSSFVQRAILFEEAESFVSSAKTLIY